MTDVVWVLAGVAVALLVGGTYLVWALDPRGQTWLAAASVVAALVAALAGLGLLLAGAA